MVKKRGKKAQITIFFIIGLVVMLTALVLFFLTNTKDSERIDKQVLDESLSYSGQSELREYVDSCVKPAILEGMEIMSLQGGYIDFFDDTKTMVVKDKRNRQVVEKDGSKRVIVDENSEGNQVPYWIYKDDITIPSIEFMENELKWYVYEESLKCINDFKPFRKENYDIDYGNMVVSVDFEKAAVVYVNFPINLRKGDVEFNEEDFDYRVPIDMRLVYEKAFELAGQEYSNKYLEHHTRSLISLYSNLDEDSLPPFSQSFSNLDCSKITWQKPDVKELLKKVLDMNVKELHIKGTDYEIFDTDNKISKKVYESFIHDFFDKPYPNLKVDYSYRPEWDFNEFDILPSLGDSLEPHTVRENKIPLVGLICAFDYTFKYTLNYPVLVEVEDKDSARIDALGNVYYENEGYGFQFILDNYLCGNQERKCTGKLNLTPDNFNIVGDPKNPLKTGGSEIKAGSNVGSLNKKHGLGIGKKTFFSNPEFFASGNNTIKVKDSFTKSPLSDVDVFYWCGNGNDCFLGRTNESGEIKTKMPYCFNGQIYFIKRGYQDKKEALTIMSSADKSFDFFMNPKKEYNVKARKIHIPTYARYYFENKSMLGKSVMDFEEKDKLMISAKGSGFISYLYPDPKDSKVEAGEGNYNLMLTSLGDVSLGSTSYGGVKAKSFSGSYMLGSIKMDWEVIEDDLAKDSIEFYAPFEKVSSEVKSWEDMDDLIMDDEGMSAELLYECKKQILEDNSIFCNCSERNFVSIDGTSNIDYRDNDNLCHKAYRVDIDKSEYIDYFKPKFI